MVFVTRVYEYIIDSIVVERDWLMTLKWCWTLYAHHIVRVSNQIITCASYGEFRPYINVDTSASMRYACPSDEYNFRRTYEEITYDIARAMFLRVTEE